MRMLLILSNKLSLIDFWMLQEWKFWSCLKKRKHLWLQRKDSRKRMGVTSIIARKYNRHYKCNNIVHCRYQSNMYVTCFMSSRISFHVENGKTINTHVVMQLHIFINGKTCNMKLFYNIMFDYYKIKSVKKIYVHNMYPCERVPSI